MTGASSSSCNLSACRITLHGRNAEMGATVACMRVPRNIPGVTKVVIRKDFVGVVAETQYQAGLAARQLVVRWNPGRALPPQRSSSNIWQQSSQTPQRGLRRRGQTACCGHYGSACEVHIPLSNARFGRHILCSGGCQIGPGNRVVRDPISLSIVAKLLGMPLESVRWIYVRGSGRGLNGADGFDAAVLTLAAEDRSVCNSHGQDEINFGAPGCHRAQSCFGVGLPHCYLGIGRTG